MLLESLDNFTYYSGIGVISVVILMILIDSLCNLASKYSARSWYYNYQSFGGILITYCFFDLIAYVIIQSVKFVQSA